MLGVFFKRVEKKKRMKLRKKQENAKNGGQKKPHCDGMIQEVIELIDQMEKEND